MVRSKKPTNSFPFFQTQNSSTSTSSFKLDSTDNILSAFALAFFGAILLLISFDINSSYVNTFSEGLKNSSTKIVLLDTNEAVKKEEKKEIVFPKKEKVITKTKEAKKNIVIRENAPKAVLASYEKTTVEIIKTPVSYSSKPAARINTTPIRTVSKKTVAKKVVNKKTVPTSPRVKKAASKSLVINSKITEDLLPSAYFSAKQKASQQGKPMLIKFGARWCLPCREMENSTFKNPKISDFLNSNYVTLAIDVDDFDGYNLKAYYNITALPTFLIFDAQGKFLAKHVNAMSSNRFMEIIENHQASETVSTPMMAEQLVIETPKKKVIPAPVQATLAQPILPIAQLTSIVAKKKNGQTIQNLKGKAKNWRSTSISFATTHLTDGQIVVHIKNLTTGEVLNSQTISLTPHTNTGAITDTTTSNYQLDISHEKKKDKHGEYAIEIYHASPQKVRLIGKTSFLKDGQFIWTK